MSTNSLPYKSLTKSVHTERLKRFHSSQNQRITTAHKRCVLGFIKNMSNFNRKIRDEVYCFNISTESVSLVGVAGVGSVALAVGVGDR